MNKTNNADMTAKTIIATAELRLVESAIAALIRKSEGRIMNYECEEIGERAVAIAHSAMKRMKFIKH